MMASVTRLLFFVIVTSLAMLSVEGFHLTDKDDFDIHDKRAHATEVSTKPTPTGTIYLAHTANLVIIALKDGCYEYTATRQEYHDLRNHHTRPKTEELLLRMIAMATNIHEIDHHTIDSINHEIQAACFDLPVYRFELPHATII